MLSFIKVIVLHLGVSEDISGSAVCERESKDKGFGTLISVIVLNIRFCV